MADTDTAATYIEFTNQTFALLLDAAATTNKRALDHARKYFEIAARPYTATTPDANIREAFDRANQIATIAAAELQTIAQKNAELAENIFKHVAKAQTSLASTWQGRSNPGPSRDGQVDAVAKSAGASQELQRRTPAAASPSSKN
jgi:hypothetical protein